MSSPQDPQEVWRIYLGMLPGGLTYQAIQSGAGSPKPYEYLIFGFHRLTKEQLHCYGPFNTSDELMDFANLHQITLEFE